ncbi:hypothetical protein ACHWQZ_G011512 [Mnemiopsis leidyi]
MMRVLILLIASTFLLLGCCQYHNTLLDNPLSLLSVQQTNSLFLDDFANNPLNYFVSNIKRSEDAKDDSAACLQKIDSLAKSFKSEESLRFVDALGKPPSGFLNGNTVLMGSYDTCKAMIKSAEYGANYKPCKIKAVMTLRNNTKVITPVTWTVCFPKECRNGNFTELKRAILKIINSRWDPIHIEEKTVITTCDVDYTYDVGAYCAIVLISIILFMVVVGTLWEPVVVLLTSVKATEERKVLVNSEHGTDDEIVPDGPALSNPIAATVPKSFIGEVFKCFSLQRTIGALLNTTTKDGQILCMNGIRVFSINWVVLGHVYYIGLGAADYTDYVSMWRRYPMAIIYNALPSVDTFLFLSGFLVSLLLSKDLARKGRFNALGYYLHRYLRLTIPFLVVTLGQGFLAHVFIRGPFQDILVPGHSNCVKWWWTNILYINNFVPWNKLELCIGQSWYLSNDFQFFVFAPIFIWLLYKSPKIGISVTLSTLVCSCVTAGIICYYNDLGPSTVFDPHAVNFTDFRLLYDKPWIRCPPYLIGLLGGWFCFKNLDSLKLYVSRLSFVTRILVSVTMWIVTCTVQYLVVFGLHKDMIKKTNGETLSLTESSLYESLARSGWGLALLVQIFMCQCGLGGFINKMLSWRGWIVLSRLTFSVYLLHYIIIQSFIVQLRHPFFYKPDYEIAILYIGFLGMSYLAAAVMYTMVEQPLIFIEKMTYRR